MAPTLLPGDRLLLLGRMSPRIGDIVALADPRGGERLLLKRVVSAAGDEVVVEGDNLAWSTDSRVFGPVDRRDIRGRAVYRYFPPGRAGLLGRERAGDPR
jgi:signal peptidase I